MKNMNNLETKKVAELRAMAKEMGLKGYSHMKKGEIIAMMTAVKEQENAEKQKVFDEARKVLGNDYSKAVAFFKNLKKVKRINTEAMPEVISFWQTLTGYQKAFVGEGGSDVQFVDDIKLVAKEIAGIYKVTAPEEDDECRDFILEYLELFTKATKTENLHKTNITMVKGSLDDIEFIDGRAVFDSSKASVFTQDEIRAARDESGKIRALRVVGSSENGFYREMMDFLGSCDEPEKKLSVTLFVGEHTQDESKEAALNSKRRFIYENGFDDIATGLHYMPGCKGPSMDRKANIMFVTAKDWSEIFQLWFQVTGTHDENGFVRAFGENVVMAKMLARLSSRGSSSFDTSKVYPEVAEAMAKARVLYVKDCTTMVRKAYNQLVAPNTLERKEDDRELTIQDGAMCHSVRFGALITLAMRQITKNEYDELINLWDAHCWKVGGGNLWNVVPGSRLAQLINKLLVVQIRHGSKKGMSIMADIENAGIGSKTYAEVCSVIPDGVDPDSFVDLRNWDIICPDSVRKFEDDEWDKYPLEICNFLKPKKGMVNLNPQFIESLEWENPNALIDIVRDLLQKAEESVDDPAKALEFHHVLGQQSEVASNLVDAITTSSSLINEVQIQKWRLDQYMKLVNDLEIGRIPVPGTYTYMISDPNGFLNATFGMELPELEAGQFVYNQLTCKAGMFRSPLIHPFEAQKVQLCEFQPYWYLHDVAVFNIKDGTADNMGGADFDGDTCAVIPDNTWQGKIIVDGIRNIDHDVWEPAQKAQKVYFRPNANDAEAMKNLINHLVASSKVDRTGIITNHASRALDISNHLRSLVYFGKVLGCSKINFVHPAAFGEARQYGANFNPCTQMLNGEKVFVARGIVEGKFDKQKKTVVWNDGSEDAIVGLKTFDEVSKYAEHYLTLVEILRVLQGREIDGAKTGVFAEGVSGLDFTDNVKVRVTPHTLMNRQVQLGRRSEEKAVDYNTFVTLSPWGRVKDFVHQYIYNADGTKKVSFITKLEENGIVKTAQLMRLLSEEEKVQLNQKWQMTNGSQKTVIEMLAERKVAYNTNIFNLQQAANELGYSLDDEESSDDGFGTLSIGDLKDKEYLEIENISKICNVSMEVMAVAAYFATFGTKDGNLRSGMSYAWICIGDLLSVFSRENDKFGWFRLPNNTEDAYIADGTLYVNGHVRCTIDAYDCDSIMTKVINNKLYGWIQRKVKKVANKECVITEYAGKVFCLSIYGFRFYQSKDAQGFINAIQANGNQFQIVECMEGSQAGRLEAVVNGVKVAGIVPTKDLSMAVASLNGKTVQVVSNEYKVNANSITELNVIVR